MTVSRRLLLLLLPALVLLMFGGGVIDYLIAVDAARNAYDQALDSAAVALTAFIQQHDDRLVFVPPTEAFNSQRGNRFDPQLYAIVGPDNALLAGNRGLLAAPVKMQKMAAGPAFYDLALEGRAVRVARVAGATPAGEVTVYFAETSQRRERTERAMLFGKLSVDFVEFDLTLLLIWLAIYVGLRPLRNLPDVVEARTTRALQAFEESEVPGEVRPLVRAFNRVLELLNDAAASQRRFVADAAHQLRTPIAGLSAQIELILRNPAAAALAPELSAINAGMARVARSANQLLSLARTEQSSIQAERFQWVALRPMLEEIIGRNVDRAETLGLDLGAELHDATIRGDIWMLQDLASNLLDNALKYTPRGGHVTVRCGVADAAPYVEVEDDGPGIPEAERRSVRQRFYRRAGEAASGCGLGLAIVDEIARVHNGKLTIDAGAGDRGARMRVRFAA
jgi:two-component system sensor histidine kinase TctE